MRHSAFLASIAILSLPTLVWSQCNNYGTSTSIPGICACPIGFSGSNCTDLSCGNPLQSQVARPVFSTALSGSSAGTMGCGTQCTTGFTGPNCNVCTTSGACSAALSTGASSSTSSTSSPASSSGLSGNALGGSGSSSSDMICSKSAWTWTEGFVSCDVINPTLQSVFPGTTTLTIQKNPNPSLSVSEIFGANGTTQAQLLYSSKTGNSTLQEQFFCKADTCTQSNSTSAATIDWDCLNLACTCIPGTAFCGGGGLNLKTTINSLSGSLSISCSTTSTTCYFKQSVLQTLFGASGLSLTGCQFGECVRTSTINALASQFSNNTTGSGGTSLVPGVIGGLVVMGAIIAGLLGLIAWGCVSQRRARRSGRNLASEKNGTGVGLRWTNIGYSLPSKSRRNLFSARTTETDDGRVLLDGISGEISPGQFLAILGPTGAGKSTFSDILAGRRKSGRTTGAVELLLPDGAAARKVKIGYVDQHDVLPSSSTVREALMFAAELKMAESFTKAEKEARVFEILTSLGLLDVADSMIGSGERRGISGGEKRRLSIGLELVAAPAILIADEPTSGLDSSSAMRVVQVLKNLTSSDSGHPVTVIATVHQPSSRVFYLFDTVLVLGAGGRQTYFGAAADASRHFGAQGKPCPEGWNPADHLLELASDPSLQKVRLPATPFVERTSSSTSSEEVIEVEPKSGLPFTNEPSHSHSGIVGSRQLKPNTVLMTQFEVLARRELRTLKRDWSLVIMHNLVSIIVGLFVGGLYYQVNLTIAGFQSRIGSIFFLGSLLAFASLSALSNLANVKALFLRERAGAYYGPVAWFLSRVAFDVVPLRIVPTIIVSCIVYWMVGLSPTAEHFFKYLLILVEFNIATTLWNLFLAAAIKESSVAILVSAILNLAQMAFAGFFLNLASIPPVLRWLQWLSPLKYMLEALAVNEVSSGLMIIDTLQGVSINVSASLIMEVLFGFAPNAYYRDVLVLFAFIGGFACLLIATVVFKLKELR